ncbi:hypothetical protein HYO29_22740 [Vibrio parahaemolyticus]|uniref:hypothetical protein n=1 Tax=Vibrio parahaemolyticus TaxID=670 RepID=UPI001122F12D|nr:hypothetical protein [Vibrio parahaemolyticus]MBM4941700.1 hypothetical protein [Vibrio parahaemolyticus]TNZ66504.1 hypothetical protein CGK42_23410 [Vibrio parahaemolyticus]
MNKENIELVLSENLGEGFRIVFEDGQISPVIEWVDWVQLSDDENDIQVAVNFEDGSEKTFSKGMMLNQIWHEDV